MMIYFKMCFKVPYFLSDHAAFAKRYCKNKQNIGNLSCSAQFFFIFLQKISCTRQFVSKPYIALACIIFADNIMLNL